MGKLKIKANQTLEKAKELFGRQVELLSQQEAKVRELLCNVGNKLARIGDSPQVKKIIEPVSIFVRMMKAHFNGTHKLSGSTVGLILLALVYFLSPIDIIPDFLGVIGFVDDLSVILAVYAKVKDEVAEFMDWERTQV